MIYTNSGKEMAHECRETVYRDVIDVVDWRIDMKVHTIDMNELFQTSRRRRRKEVVTSLDGTNDSNIL